MSEAKWKMGILLPHLPATGQTVKLMASSRNWIFTCYYQGGHNPVLSDDNGQAIAGRGAGFELIEALVDNESFRGIIFQEEMCPSTGRPHLQGFIRCYRGTTMERLKRSVAPYSLSLKRADYPLKAIDYCRKAESRLGEIYENGDLCFEQGENSEWDSCKLYLTTDPNPNLEHCALSFPGSFIRYHAGIKQLLFIRQKALIQQRLQASLDSEQSLACEVIVYYGATTTGKTFSAVKNYPGCYIVERAKGASDAWFDGYDGERTIVLDDFYGWVPYDRLLKMCRKYPQTAEVKGATVWKQWERVVITTNAHPRTWYPHGLSPALRARITYFFVFHEDGREPTLVEDFEKLL